MVKQYGLTVPGLHKIAYGNGTPSNIIVEVLDVAGYTDWLISKLFNSKMSRFLGE